MKKMFIWILSIIMILIIAVPSNCTYASSIKDLDAEEINEKLRTKNYFEIVLSDFCLTVGDYAHDYLSKIFKEEITIDSLVYNKANLTNANFFANSENASHSTATKAISEVINKWYEVFRKITLVVCMASLVVAGIKIILNTPDGKVKAWDILKKVVISIALVFLFPYVMKLSFDLNEAIINTIYSKFHLSNEVVGIAISEVSDLQPDELEFRSPEYVSKRTLTVSAGSIEATQLYLSRLEKYSKSADIMRIMRAFAGVTLRFLYVLIWYVMLAQLYMLAFVYVKRYITIAFLIAIYPLTIVGYITGGLMGQAQTSFNEWCKKFFTNVFLQTIHAVTYGVICSVLVSQIQEELICEKFSKVNWVLMVVSVSFLFTGEKILIKLWNAATGPESREGLRSAIGAPKAILGRIRGK